MREYTEYPDPSEWDEVDRSCFTHFHHQEKTMTAHDHSNWEPESAIERFIASFLLVKPLWTIPELKTRLPGTPGLTKDDLYDDEYMARVRDNLVPWKVFRDDDNVFKIRGNKQWLEHVKASNPDVQESDLFDQVILGIQNTRALVHELPCRKRFIDMIDGQLASTRDYVAREIATRKSNK